MTHVDLFSGIGGFALAARWAGFKTIAFCEIDEYAQRVLIKNFGAVMADAGRERDGTIQHEPITERSEAPNTGQGGQDVAHASESQNRRPRIFRDIRQLDGTQFQGVELLTAGVPCQPASCAGKRRGKADDRWLWPEALRVLREAAPACAVFENPPGILSLESGVEFEHLLSEMESYGYSVQPIIVPACAVDARHRRDRVWIVAHRADNGQPRPRLSGAEERQAIADDCNGCAGDVADATQQLRTVGGRETHESRRGGKTLADGISAGLEERQEQSARQECQTAERSVATSFSRWPDEAEWFAQSGMGRVASRVPNRVDRLRCLGNSIVPQVAYQILKAIVEIETEGAK